MTASDTGPTDKVRKIVKARSHGICEFADCGHPATEIHHRYERGMGGSGPKSPAAAWINEPANLLHSCQHHNQWCTNVEPREAYEIGWIIHEVLGEPELPWTVPVVTAHHPLPIFLSNDDGAWACFAEYLPENQDGGLREFEPMKQEKSMQELVELTEQMGLYE